MFLDEFNKKSVREFFGLRDALSRDKLPEQAAEQADNVEFRLTSLTARRGFVSFATTVASAAIQWFISWFGSNYNRILYYTIGGSPAVGDVRLKDLVSGADASLTTFSTPGESLACGIDGTFAYISPFARNATSKLPDGVANPKVICPNATVPGTLAADDMWPADPGPSSISSTSVITFGTGAATNAMTNRKIIFVWTTRSGFVCRPLQSYGITFNTAAGTAYVINFTVSAGINPQYRYVALAINTPQNPNQFFLFTPNFFASPGGTGAFVLSESDAQLRTHEDITYLNFEFQQGTPYSIRPFLIKPFKSRMCYGANVPNSAQASGTLETRLFVSDAGLAQNISVGRSAVQLPDTRVFCAGEQYGDGLYLMGPGYTYAVYDTGEEDPVNWQAPIMINGKIGARQPSCIARRSDGTLLVADDSGLYTFNGQYPDLPMNYYSTNIWRRINWAAPMGTIVVRDDADNSQALVFAPLDGAEMPTHMMVFNYERGFTPDRIRATIFRLPSWATQALDRVLDPATQLYRLVIGYSGAEGQAFWRQRQWGEDIATLYSDGNLPVASTYVHAPLPLEERTRPKTFKGAQSRLSVLGKIVSFIENFPRTRATTLAGAEGDGTTERVVTDTHIINEQTAGLVFGIVGSGGWSLDEIDIYWKPWIWQGGDEAEVTQSMDQRQTSGPYYAIPTGTIDGQNFTFTIPHTLEDAGADIEVFLAGVTLQYGVGYTISGTTLTMNPVYIPQVGQEFWIRYWLGATAVAAC